MNLESRSDLSSDYVMNRLIFDNIIRNRIIFNKVLGIVYYLIKCQKSYIV